MRWKNVFIEGRSMATQILVPGTLGPLAAGAAHVLAERGYEAVDLGAIAPEDIDCGLAHIDNDVCVATVAVIGQYVRYFQQHPEAIRTCGVLACELCRDCRSLSVPDLLATSLARAGLSDVEIVEFSSAETASSAQSFEPVTIERDLPVVGVCGNLPVLTTEEFRATVVEHLEQSGCHVVLPPLQAIVDKRDFMTPALEYFAQEGIETVICILPFGCLGGHVFGRGQLRKLQKRFPTLGVTILDYDPSASDINLINRTELVIQSAREKLQDQDDNTAQ